jgi:tripartite-type tricarboxylate transporter receptor subunit TctC
MKTARSRVFLTVALAFAGLLSGPSANGQEFPTRLIKIIVPYPAGGGVDGLARPIAERLGRLWGQSVIIENKPGASTMIGGADVARATPDGHTLLFTSDSSITSNPHLFKKMLYDPIKELAPVTQLIDLHQFVLVHPSVGANTIKELVALAKEKPNALNYGSYGKGSQPHLLFEMLRKETGAQIQQIAYRGIAPAITAAISGEVQMTLGSVAVAAGHIESKKLKALAIGREARMPSHPEIPTLKEAGFSDIEPRSWFGLFAPAGTSPSVIGKIQKDVAAVLKEPEFQARFIERAGHTAVASTPEAFATFIQNDLKAKGNMIATAGITAE